MSIDLCCFTYIDILQPRPDLSRSARATIRSSQASLFIEVSPGMDVNVVTDIALKRTCTPGLQIVERHSAALSSTTTIKARSARQARRSSKP